MSQVNKRTRYFLTAVVLFGIIPLLVMRVSGSKKNVEAVKVISEIPQIANSYNAKPENSPALFAEKNISRPLKTNVAPLPRDPFSAEEVMNYLIASQNEFDTDDSTDNLGRQNLNVSNSIELKGIMIDGKMKYSVINDRVLEEGDEINGMTVISIKANEVLIGNSNRNYSLNLND